MPLRRCAGYRRLFCGSLRSSCYRPRNGHVNEGHFPGPLLMKAGRLLVPDGTALHLKLFPALHRRGPGRSRTLPLKLLRQNRRVVVVGMDWDLVRQPYLPALLRPTVSGPGTLPASPCPTLRCGRPACPAPRPRTAPTTRPSARSGPSGGRKSASARERHHRRRRTAREATAVCLPARTWTMATPKSDGIHLSFFLKSGEA